MVTLLLDTAGTTDVSERMTGRPATGEASMPWGTRRGVGIGDDPFGVRAVSFGDDEEDDYEGFYDDDDDDDDDDEDDGDPFGDDEEGDEEEDEGGLDAGEGKKREEGRRTTPRYA